MINAERARELGTLFLFMHESEPGAEVNMLKYTFHQCGTIACHAGWFAVANGKDWDPDYSFSDAANEMAQFLGFGNRDGLESWAKNNPALWGNDFGDVMFSRWAAFSPNLKLPKTLETIGLHWLGVADRIEDGL